MRKIKLIPVALASLFSLSLLPSLASSAKADNKTYYVDFFNNFKREEFVLSSGFSGKGNNLLYKTIEVGEGELVTKPTDPVRKSYSFLGWFLEENCENPWDFAASRVTKNTRLFAKWEYDGGDNTPEPPYTPPSTVLDESAPTSYELYSIMNFKVNEYNILKLPKAALDKLELYKDDVTPLMEYKVKASKEFSATFDGSVIHIDCEGEEPYNITVTNNSNAYILSNNDYENKASKYEAKVVDEENENYHVMLAGSSSIEFWETSKTDLDPIVSYNHGIGGTTIEQWTEKLNQRLVYPYKPKMVVYYVGINNVINSKESTEDIIAHLEDFFNETHAALPNTKVQYILMNMLGDWFKEYFPIIKAVNAWVKEYQKNQTDWLTLINAGDYLIKDGDTVNMAYFRNDNLHLSPYGYTIWGSVIKKSILQGLEDMNK